jgi:hypothetical protein
MRKGGAPKGLQLLGIFEDGHDNARSPAPRLAEEFYAILGVLPAAVLNCDQPAGRSQAPSYVHHAADRCLIEQAPD